MFPRIHTILFFLATLMLLVRAAPTPDTAGDDSDDVGVMDAGLREVETIGSAIADFFDDFFRRDVSTSLVVTAFVTLEGDVDSAISTLDGKVSPVAALAKVTTAVYACMDDLVKLNITTITAAEAEAVVSIFVSVISNILAALGRYNLLTIAALCSKLDVALALLIKTAVGLNASILAGLVAGVKSQISVFSALKMSATIAGLGLKAVSV